MILPEHPEIRQVPAQNVAPFAGGYRGVKTAGTVIDMAGALSRSSAWFNQNRYPSPYVWSDRVLIRPGTFPGAGNGVHRVHKKNAQRGRQRCRSKQSPWRPVPLSPWQDASGTTCSARAQGLAQGPSWPEQPAVTFLPAHLSVQGSAQSATTSTSICVTNSFPTASCGATMHGNAIQAPWGLGGVFRLNSGFCPQKNQTKGPGHV